MKRQHRRRHLITWLILPPVLAAILWLAIQVRPDAPLNETLPSSLIEAAS